MKASRLFAQALENEGVEYVFGIPREENLDLLDTLSGSTQIRLVLTRHEQPAGVIAATFGRLTGQAGVCLSTLGPGATDLFTAAAHGQLGAMPMVMITGQKRVKHSKQGRFQIVDVVDMMGPITKYSSALVSAATIATCARSCRRRASSVSTTAPTSSGLRATTTPPAPTPRSSTTRSPPWARGCRPPSPRSGSMRISRSWR